MSSTDDRWYAFVRREGQGHVREDCEGYVFADYEQALAWRERTEAERADVVASGLIPEAVREHTRQLAATYRRAEHSKRHRPAVAAAPGLGGPRQQAHDHSHE